MSKLVLGLDIGITSVGYGVIDITNNKFVDYGVRLFKEGTVANNEERRTKRGGRRLKRRKQNRISDMSNLLEKEGIKGKDYKPTLNPYEMRIKGLNEKLTNDELTCAILHLTKNRGSNLDFLDDADKEDDGTKAILGQNKKELDVHGFVCKVQYHRLQETGKIRGIDNNFKTEDYVNEAKEILKHQELSEEVNEKILEIISRRRKYYEGPGSAISPTPYGRWTDFNVEPIDLIEKMRGRCSVFPDEFRAPKYSYTAELFDFLNDLNNLSFEGEKLTVDQKKDILEIVHNKGSITPSQLAKYLNIDIKQIKGFRIDTNEKPLLTEFKGYKAIKKIMDKYDCNIYEKDKKIIDFVAEILTKKKGISERVESIQSSYPELDEMLIDELAKIKGITQYHSLSFKAMRLINEEMLTSEMNQMQVLHQLHLFDKNRKSTKGQKNIYADDEAILSPVAKRAQREAFKIINKLRDVYGEFDSIVIETTRDKNSNEKASRIRKMQKQNENNNKEVDALLKKEGYNPKLIKGKTKQKIRLYMEQHGKSAYTLQTIDLNLLINDDTAYEIDHIIPISISLDDSFNNKVLATHSENQSKGNLTPVDAYLKGKFNGCTLETYRSYVNSNKLISKKKREYLLFEENINKFSVIQNFIARNLVDTSYANRVVMNQLTDYFKDNEISTKVHTVRGSLTNIFRKRVNFEKDREQDYFHHAIDALIVASIKKLNILNTYLSKYNINDLYDDKTGELFEVGDDKEVLDPFYISWIKDLKTIHEETYQYYNGYIEKTDMKFKPIKISHKIDTKPNRQIADETIYSTRNVNGIDLRVKKYSDIYDPKFDVLTNSIINDDKIDMWLMYHNDPQTFEIIKMIVMNHFNTFKNDNDKYTLTIKKGKFEYKLKGNNNPLYLYKQEHGKVRKYSKKNNGPEITSMKYFDGQLNSYIPITQNYDTKNKKVVLLQISPYRSDFYLSPEGKYKFVTVRYCNVFYKKSIDKYCIDPSWYEKQKQKKGIDDTWLFVCSLHHDELLGVQKKFGEKYIYDLSKEKKGIARLYKGNDEILKFTGTKNDDGNVIEVKPIYTYTTERCTPSSTTLISLKKYATDVLGNLYEVKNNILKLEFD